MAKPIELIPKKATAEGVREELKRRVDAAPLEHAEAVLDAYELLQQLHESGTLDVLRGLLGAGDQVVRHAVGLAIKPESVSLLRNVLVLSSLLSGINTEKLEAALSGVPAALAQQTAGEPPSLLSIFRRLSSVESRRALNAAATLLQSVGKGLA
ncbi:MAG: DUF1641 domain-containing protein [Acidobacteriaceae bacterium]|nr:DUF1641 domain-containing protein [Acidobacteriaceae bacterium]